MSQNAPQHLLPAAKHFRLKSRQIEIFDLLLKASNLCISSTISALSATLTILALGPEERPTAGSAPSCPDACIDARPKSDVYEDPPTSMSENANAFCGQISAIIISSGRPSIRSIHLAVAANQSFRANCLWAISSVTPSMQIHLVSREPSGQQINHSCSSAETPSNISREVS